MHWWWYGCGWASQRRVIQNLNIKRFLSKNWQSKPLLIRGALPNFKNPLSPDELAGLSMNGISESRIVNQLNSKYSLQQGPFTRKTFKNLHGKWTLLVQEVDKIVPDVKKILNQFNFLPSWRMDDIMISYAVDGAGVGPHIDNYDVFLIQAHGSRKWKWSKNKVFDEELIQNSEVRLLKNPQFDYEEILKPGDMLYLPPRIAHDGVAVGECMTISVGFRAPTARDLIQDYLAKLVSELEDQIFYSDPKLKKYEDPYKIFEPEMKKMLKFLNSNLNNQDLQLETIGNVLTQPKEVLPEPPENPLDNKEFLQKFQSDHKLKKSEASNFCYYESKSEVLLFVNGSCEKFPKVLKKFIQAICNEPVVKFHKKFVDYKDVRRFIYNHYLNGVFYFD